MRRPGALAATSATWKLTSAFFTAAAVNPVAAALSLLRSECTSRNTSASPPELPLRMQFVPVRGLREHGGIIPRQLSTGRTASSFVTEFAMEPRFGQTLFATDCRGRNSHSHCSLLHAEAAEKSQFNHSRLPLVNLGERL